MDSKTVFALRNEAKDLEGISKLNKLIEAFNIAQRLFSTEPYDDWIQKAFAYTLIDLSKYYIADRNINQAGVYFNQLLSIEFQEIDEIIENQKNFLRPKIDINYSDVQKAEEYSKNGNNIEALAIFKNLISQNRLTELHHESYGWIIYRYIKAEESNLSSVDVRTFLRDYMNLKNERPSMLHSMVLNFALNYSKTHKDFNFYNFFLLWNPDKLRHEDLHNGYKEGKDIPSLISRICREFVNSKTEINIGEFLSKINLKKEVVLDFFRETIFWNILNAHKENKFSELWNLFEQYNINYSKHGQSKWHSEILNLAERFMKENDELRFLNFFRNWNPENLRIDDWKETNKDDHTYKPLAIKAIKKAFEILKTQLSEQDLSWLLKTYETAIKLFPEDEWLLREKAILHFKNNQLDIAIKIYKQLVLELSDKHYIWQEFSECIDSDNPLKIGMLSKALSLEKNEDFLGDIHLDLAKSLISENLFENALVELKSYKKHREIKGWKLSSLYEELFKKVSSVKQSFTDNRELYKKYIPIAENFVYADFDWTEVVVVNKWKDEKGKERLVFSNGKSIEFTISKNRYEILKHSDLGQILKAKLYKQEFKKEVDNRFSWQGKNTITEYKYIPLILEKSDKQPWEILENAYAVVDYINKEKKIIHAITSDNIEVFFPQNKIHLCIGDFVKAKIYEKKVKNENRTELRQIQKIDKSSVLSKFQSQIAIVDGVNEQKQLFHFIISSKLQGIVKFTETNIRPNEGDFIKLSFATKIDREKKLRVKALNIELTEDTNPDLCKEIEGRLCIKFDIKFDYDEFFFNSSIDFPIEFDSDWSSALSNAFEKGENTGPLSEELDRMIDLKDLILCNEHWHNSENFKESTDEKGNNVPAYPTDIPEEMFNNLGEVMLDKIHPEMFYDLSLNRKKSLINNEIDNKCFSYVIDVIKINRKSIKIHNEYAEFVKNRIAQFAFIEDHYVPKYLLDKHGIKSDCNVIAKAVFTGEKWKVIEIKKTN